MWRAKVGRVGYGRGKAEGWKEGKRGEKGGQREWWGWWGEAVKQEAVNEEAERWEGRVEGSWGMRE